LDRLLQAFERSLWRKILRMGEPRGCAGKNVSTDNLASNQPPTQACDQLIKTLAQQIAGAVFHDLPGSGLVPDDMGIEYLESRSRDGLPALEK